MWSSSVSGVVRYTEAYESHPGLYVDHRNRVWRRKSHRLGMHDIRSRHRRIQSKRGRQERQRSEDYVGHETHKVVDQVRAVRLRRKFHRRNETPHIQGPTAQEKGHQGVQIRRILGNERPVCQTRDQCTDSHNHVFSSIRLRVRLLRVTKNVTKTEKKGVRGTGVIDKWNWAAGI